MAPVALRYTVDLGAELDARWASRQCHEQKRMGASAVRALGADDVFARRGTLAALLDSALTAAAPERPAFERLTAPGVMAGRRRSAAGARAPRFS